MPKLKNKSKGEADQPQVYKAVRAVGILRPKFQPKPQGPIFAESLDIRGTAFWLKEYKILVTCTHVVRDLVGAPVEVTGLLVVGNKGNYVRAIVDSLDFSHDLAILRIPSDVPKDVINIEKESREGLEIANKYPTVGKAVAYAGFPLGLQLLNSSQDPTYSEGVIGAQIRHRGLRKVIQITGPVVGGHSGTPVVLKNDPSRVIGVLAHSPSKDAGNANIFMAISWEHIKAIAELSKS